MIADPYDPVSEFLTGDDYRGARMSRCRFAVDVEVDDLTAPCESCGHAYVLHPGLPNPRLDTCLACTVVEAATLLEAKPAADE